MLNPSWSDDLKQRFLVRQLAEAKARNERLPPRSIEDDSGARVESAVEGAIRRTGSAYQRAQSIHPQRLHLATWEDHPRRSSTASISAGTARENKENLRGAAPAAAPPATATAPLLPSLQPPAVAFPLISTAPARSRRGSKSCPRSGPEAHRHQRAADVAFVRQHTTFTTNVRFVLSADIHSAAHAEAVAVPVYHAPPGGDAPTFTTLPADPAESQLALNDSLQRRDESTATLSTNPHGNAQLFLASSVEGGLGQFTRLNLSVVRLTATPKGTDVAIRHEADTYCGNCIGDRCKFDTTLTELIKTWQQNVRLQQERHVLLSSEIVSETDFAQGQQTRFADNARDFLLQRGRFRAPTGAPASKSAASAGESYFARTLSITIPGTSIGGVPATASTSSHQRTSSFGGVAPGSLLGGSAAEGGDGSPFAMLALTPNGEVPPETEQVLVQTHALTLFLTTRVHGFTASVTSLFDGFGVREDAAASRERQLVANAEVIVAVASRIVEDFSGADDSRTTLLQTRTSRSASKKKIRFQSSLLGGDRCPQLSVAVAIDCPLASESNIVDVVAGWPQAILSRKGAVAVADLLPADCGERAQHNVAAAATSLHFFAGGRNQAAVDALADSILVRTKPVPFVVIPVRDPTDEDDLDGDGDSSPDAPVPRRAPTAAITFQAASNVVESFKLRAREFAARQHARFDRVAHLVNTMLMASQIATFVRESRVLCTAYTEKRVENSAFVLSSIAGVGADGARPAVGVIPRSVLDDLRALVAVIVPFGTAWTAAKWERALTEWIVGDAVKPAATGASASAPDFFLPFDTDSAVLTGFVADFQRVQSQHESQKQQPTTARPRTNTAARLTIPRSDGKPTERTTTTSAEVGRRRASSIIDPKRPNEILRPGSPTAKLSVGADDDESTTTREPEIVAAPPQSTPIIDGDDIDKHAVPWKSATARGALHRSHDFIPRFDDFCLALSQAVGARLSAIAEEDTNDWLRVCILENTRAKDAEGGSPLDAIDDETDTWVKRRRERNRRHKPHLGAGRDPNSSPSTSASSASSSDGDLDFLDRSSSLAQSSVTAQFDPLIAHFTFQVNVAGVPEQLLFPSAGPQPNQSMRLLSFETFTDTHTASTLAIAAAAVQRNLTAGFIHKRADHQYARHVNAMSFATRDGVLAKILPFTEVSSIALRHCIPPQLPRASIESASYFVRLVAPAVPHAHAARTQNKAFQVANASDSPATRSRSLSTTSSIVPTGSTTPTAKELERSNKRRLLLGLPLLKPSGTPGSTASDRVSSASVSTSSPVGDREKQARPPQPALNVGGNDKSLHELVTLIRTKLDTAFSAADGAHFEEMRRHAVRFQRPLFPYVTLTAGGAFRLACLAALVTMQPAASFVVPGPAPSTGRWTTVGNGGLPARPRTAATPFFLDSIGLFDRKLHRSQLGSDEQCFPAVRHSPFHRMRFIKSLKLENALVCAATWLGLVAVKVRSADDFLDREQAAVSRIGNIVLATRARLAQNEGSRCNPKSVQDECGAPAPGGIKTLSTTGDLSSLTLHMGVQPDLVIDQEWGVVHLLSPMACMATHSCFDREMLAPVVSVVTALLKYRLSSALARERAHNRSRRGITVVQACARFRVSQLAAAEHLHNLRMEVADLMKIKNDTTRYLSRVLIGSDQHELKRELFSATKLQRRRDAISKGVAAVQLSRSSADAQLYDTIEAFSSARRRVWDPISGQMVFLSPADENDYFDDCDGDSGADDTDTSSDSSIMRALFGQRPTRRPRSGRLTQRLGRAALNEDQGFAGDMAEILMEGPEASEQPKKSFASSLFVATKGLRQQKFLAGSPTARPSASAAHEDDFDLLHIQASSDDSDSDAEREREAAAAARKRAAALIPAFQHLVVLEATYRSMIEDEYWIVAETTVLEAQMRYFPHVALGNNENAERSALINQRNTALLLIFSSGFGGEHCVFRAAIVREEERRRRAIVLDATVTTASITITSGERDGRRSLTLLEEEMFGVFFTPCAHPQLLVFLQMAVHLRSLLRKIKAVAGSRGPAQGANAIAALLTADFPMGSSSSAAGGPPSAYGGANSASSSATKMSVARGRKLGKATTDVTTKTQEFIIQSMIRVLEGTFQGFNEVYIQERIARAKLITAVGIPVFSRLEHDQRVRIAVLQRRTYATLFLFNLCPYMLFMEERHQREMLFFSTALITTELHERSLILGEQLQAWDLLSCIALCERRQVTLNEFHAPLAFCDLEQLNKVINEAHGDGVKFSGLVDLAERGISDIVVSLRREREFIKGMIDTIHSVDKGNDIDRIARARGEFGEEGQAGVMSGSRSSSAASEHLDRDQRHLRLLFDGDGGRHQSGRKADNAQNTPLRKRANTKRRTGFADPIENTGFGQGPLPMPGTSAYYRSHLAAAAPPVEVRYFMHRAADPSAASLGGNLRRGATFPDSNADSDGAGQHVYVHPGQRQPQRSPSPQRFRGPAADPRDEATVVELSPFALNPRVQQAHHEQSTTHDRSVAERIARLRHQRPPVGLNQSTTPRNTSIL